MAFTVTARHSAAPTTTSGLSRATDSTTPTASSLLLVGVGAEHDVNNAAGELSVSGGSLTWTDIQEVDDTTSPAWNGDAAYRLDAGLYRATVGASPSAFAITATTTRESFIPVVACDITGHDTTTPIVQSKALGASEGGGDSESTAITLDSAPTAGNLLVCFIAAGADSGGGFTAPYAGAGRTFTAAHNQNSGGYAQAYIGSRVVQSGDSSTITCDDLGTTVGNSVIVVVEIAAEAGSGVTGTAAVTLPTAAAAATGSVTVPSFTGTAAIDLPAVVAAATGTFTPPGETGTAAVTLPALSVSASGSVVAPGVTGTAAVTLPTVTAFGTSGRFPVSVSGRNLLDATGTAWFGVGDAPWALVGQLTTAQITTYLEDRASKGYRIVMFSAPEGYYSDNGAGYNANNDYAFTGTAFQSSLNDDYWQVVDHAVNECLRLGITALICPAYTGSAAGDGWDTEMDAASNSQMYDYGLAVGGRYKDHPNIMWLAGHDRDFADSTVLMARYAWLQDGIKAAGDTHLWLPGGWNEGGTYSQGTTDWPGADMAWDVETNYDYSFQSVLSTRAAWDNGSLPVVHLEGSYENERSGTLTGTTDPDELRYQAWGGFVAGAVCHIYGNDPMWHFNNIAGETTWTGHLDDTGAVDMGHVADVLAAHDWSGTVPDTTDTFLTAGESSGTTQAGARFGGTLALVYMPTARSVTLDLTELTGTSFTITRIDPASGAESVLTTSASGSHVVASQGTNSGGDTDWVLLIESNGTDATGTATVTLPAVTVSGSGTVTPPAFTGAAAVGLPTVTAAASGTHTPPPITGTATPTLPAVTVSASGTVENPPGNAGAAAVTLPTVTADASGTVTVPPITGTAALTLPTVTAAASGTIDNPGFDGTASVTLPTPTVAATGTFVPAGVTGTAAVQIPSPTVAAAGTRTIPPITGTADVTLPALTASGYSEFPAAPASRTLTIPAESRTVVVT